jgi:PIN domain nuclease of toxin-antitoxin system
MDPASLGPRATKVLKTERDVFVSAASYWEIAVKSGLGKLKLEGLPVADLPAHAHKLGFTSLPLDAEDTASLVDLPRRGERSDPFGRMLAWQAIRGRMTLLSADPAFAAWAEDGLKLLW